MKLSDAQLRLLKRFKRFGEGGQLERGHWGAEVWHHWKGGTRTKGLRSATIHKLWQLGFIRDIDPNPFETTYAITNKGREYLRGLEQGSAKGAR